MYKGNMRDFVEKVDIYLRREYDCMLSYIYTSNTQHLIAFFEPGAYSAPGYEVFDREDFEQQVYDYVNEELKNILDVQGQYPDIFQ